MTLTPKKHHNPPACNEIEVSLFGPGFGECILIHVGSGEWVVIDSCKSSKTGNPVALDYLEELGVEVSKKISYLICSHWHDDHIRGFSELVEKCKSAKVVCSDALHSKEFVNMIAAFSGGTMMMRNPGTKEIYSTFEQLKTRKSDLIWASKDRIIVDKEILMNSGEPKPFKIAALSPSDYSITEAKCTCRAMYPKVYKPKRSLRSQNLNISSVVTYIEVDDMAILLGGDMEVTENQDSGWDCIIHNRQVRTKRSFIYKVAHHGSKTGHHCLIWKNMLTEEPVSILTPFRKGNIFLPQAEDIQCLNSMNGSSYITASPGVSFKPRRSRSVQKTINEATRSHSVWEPQTGHLRIRKTLNATKHTMELFNGAYKL